MSAGPVRALPAGWHRTRRCWKATASRSARRWCRSTRRRPLRPGTIGKPLPGVEVRVVDLESEAALPAGQMGMLQVSGPTVFPGYLGHDGRSPFEEKDGKRWYVTGDLARAGRRRLPRGFAAGSKRFLKAGGEMISLPALEEPFARLYPPTHDGPRVAVEGVEHEHGRQSCCSRPSHSTFERPTPYSCAKASAG